MKKTMFLIDVKNNSFGVENIDTKDVLQQYYKLLDCDLIDIATRRIGDKVFDIICDDEGLLKENAIPSAVNKAGEVQLVGNLLICNIADNEGNEVGLDADDVMYIYKNLMKATIVINDEEKEFPILTNCDYCQ